MKPSEAAPTRVIPEAVSEVILKALARHPGARFQSATEMRKAIDRAIAQASGGHRSRRFLGALAAVMAVLAIATGAAAAKRETLAARLPPRLAALFVKHASAPALPAPVAQPEPARTTDLAQVPLGEGSQLDAKPAIPGAPAANANNGASANSGASANNGANADDTDPALDDPAEHDDVLAADLVPSAGDAAPSDAPAQQVEAAPSAAPKPAPVKPVRVRHTRRSLPKLPAKPVAPHGASQTHADTAPQHGDASHGDASHDAQPKAHKSGDAPATRSLKDMAPPKDSEESARRKKKKVRLARAQ